MATDPAQAQAAPAIILVTPQLGENIGAAARAMLNCGLTDLRLVNPRDGWPSLPAERAAVGALELMPHYPQLADMRLVDFKVRILTPQAGTEAITRVMIESADKTGERWSTVGVSGNIIDASYEALNDAITWKLLKSRGN